MTVVILVVAAAMGGAAVASHDFSDVPDAYPFHDDISWLASTGVTEGYQDGTYRPSQPVTRGSMAAFLRRLAGADPAVPPVVDAAELAGRSPADYDNAVTLQGQTPAQLLPKTYRFGAPASVNIAQNGTRTVVSTIATPPPVGSYLAHIDGRIGATVDSAVVSCNLAGINIAYYHPASMDGMRVGDVAPGHSRMMPVSADMLLTFPQPGVTDLTFGCSMASMVGSGTVTAEGFSIIFEEVEPW